MADQQSLRDLRESPSKRRGRHRLFQLQWTYLRGWLVIAAIFVLAKLVVKMLSGADEWFGPYFDSLQSTAWKVAFALVILLIVPWALGKIVLVPWRLFRGSRGMQVFEQIEGRLATELRPDESRGYRVALIDFPNQRVRTLGVVGATVREPETGRQLAAVYLPGTPDPTKGSVMVVDHDDLKLTDWTLQDLIGYHLTMGSGGPPS